MGKNVDKLVALAGTVKVEAHKRTTKSGKVVDVDAYTRSPSDMSNVDIISEIQGLNKKAASGRLPSQDANRYQALASELRKRKSEGKLKVSDFADAQNGPSSVSQAVKEKLKGQANNLELSGLKKTSPGGNSPALQKWYAEMKNSKVDDYGKSAAERLSDEELDEAIEERKRLNAESKFGMSGSMDLKVLEDEKARRGKVSLSGLHGEAVENLLRLTRYV